MDTLIGIIIGRFLGNLDHNCKAEPPTPTVAQECKAGWERGRTWANNSRLMRWMESLPGGRGMKEDR